VRAAPRPGTPVCQCPRGRRLPGRRRPLRPRPAHGRVLPVPRERSTAAAA